MGDVVRALEMIISEGLSLARYNDKLILALAKGRRSPLATFDSRLRKQAERAGVKVLP